MTPELLLILNDISLIAVVVSGVLAIGLGDWDALRLKFACVVFCTATALWLLIAMFLLNRDEFCGITSVYCISGGAYHVARNIIMTGFNLAAARDAMHLRCGDRRRAGGK
ncbi:MAG: hypothetical protein K2Q12_07285 [Rickettsiales bacterium]|nr:hypothetical protein [Rickettsiales bacterium]